MKRRSLAVVAIAAAAAVALTLSGPQDRASCSRDGTGIYAAPDRSPGCTPGMWISDPAVKETPAAGEYDPDVTAAHVCSKGYNPRPGVDVSGPLKRQALRLYGDPLSFAKDSEADHWFPRWAGGATALPNFWPEPNYLIPPDPYTHNPKDRLELVVYKLTCQQHRLSIAQARAVFEGDWRAAYKLYVGPLASKP